MTKKTILIADDHELISEGVSNYLSKKMDARFLTAKSKAELMCHLNQNQIDLILLDVQFGPDDGRVIFSEIKSINPTCAVIALSSHSDEFTVKSVLATGFNAYITKSAPMDEIYTGIIETLSGNHFISSDLHSKFQSSLFKNSKNDELVLTQRELEVLKALQDGMTSREIGEKLFISEKTVETYRSNLFIKFNVKNVASLVKVSLLKGFH